MADTKKITASGQHQRSNREINGIIGLLSLKGRKCRLLFSQKKPASHISDYGNELLEMDGVQKMRLENQALRFLNNGHGETKATCLWLKNLPKLVPTQIVSGREPRIHKMAPGPDRWKERSRTYPGIAQAMAMQWGVDFEMYRVA